MRMRFIEYPHAFGNYENLPFTCGSNNQAFPIQMDGQVYDGGDVTDIPDRVVFEVKLNKDNTQLTIAFCGVMRHGPPVPPLKRDFISCP
jgi:ribonuclease